MLTPPGELVLLTKMTRHLQDYMFLTFARVPPPPPPPWVETHALLQKAVQDFVRKQQTTVAANVHQSLVAAAADLSLEWYVGMLARLHINSFRSASIVHLQQLTDCLQHSQLLSPSMIIA